MDSTVVQTVSGVLDELAARFGSTGVHLWEQLVGYEYTMALYSACFIGFAWVLFIVACAMAWWQDELDWLAVAFGGAIVLIITGIIGSYAIPTMAFPEAAAMKALF